MLLSSPAGSVGIAIIMSKLPLSAREYKINPEVEAPGLFAVAAAYR